MKMQFVFLSIPTLYWQQGIDRTKTNANMQRRKLEE